MHRAVATSLGLVALTTPLAAVVGVGGFGFGFIDPPPHRNRRTTHRRGVILPSSSMSTMTKHLSSSTRGTLILRMSLYDDLSSGGGGGGGGSSSSGSSSGNAGNVESSSGEEDTVRRYTDAPSFDGHASEEDVLAMEESSSSVASSAAGGEDVVRRRHPDNDNDNDACQEEFHVNTLSERTARAISDTRRKRWTREAAAKSKFIVGDDLHDMRARIVGLRRELANGKLSMSNPTSGSSTAGAAMVGWEGGQLFNARKINDTTTTLGRRAQDIEMEIATLNDRDPEFVYAMSRDLMERAVADDDRVSVMEYRVKMEDAMSCMPQMNLHGLWVGKYGEHGYEMINITYTNDSHTLIATKVTGDENVPQGEVTFTVDLAPRTFSSDDELLRRMLDPIELDMDARKRWGRRYLPRHPGRGRVAQTNFVDPAWMEGQMILVGDYFSFAWVPIGKQIFFGRPSPELTIRMVREAEQERMRREGDDEDTIGAMRDAAMGMMEETYWIEREGTDTNDGRCFE